MNDQIDLGPLERAPVDTTHRLAKFRRLMTGHRSLLPLVIVLLAVIAGIALTNGGSLSSTPIDYYEDSLFQYGVASSANEAGLTATHPRLNYPFGADWRDFAIHTDTASVAQYWVISFFSDSPIQIVNVAYVLSYLFCAAAFYGVARSFKIHEAIATGLAIGYAFLPYHFFRGIHHQFMSQYWTLPILVWLAAQIAWGPNPRDRKSQGKLVAAGLVCALNGAYYTIFGVMLLGLAVIFRLVSSRPALSLRHWRSAMWGLGGFGVGGVLALLPSALLRMSDGVNTRTPSRNLSDGDMFSLRPALMFAPVADHRFGPFSEWAANIARMVPGGEREAMSIGTAASLGVVLAIVLVAARSLRAGATTNHARSLTLGGLALLTTTFFALAMTVGGTGGLHWDVGLAGFKLIRSWGRSSVLIATLAMLTLGAAASAWWSARDRATRPGRVERLTPGAKQVIAVVLSVAIGGAMVWDQYPNRTFGGAQQNEFEASKSFYASLEADLPAGTAVFQLPVVPFPEHWMGSLLYQSLEGVFFTKTLKFSGGGIAGRQADWQESLVASPEELFAQLRDAGFGAVVVDRRGFGDPQWFIDQYQAVPAVQVVVEDQFRTALDISGVRAPLAREGFDLVNQPTVAFVDGFNKAVDGFSAASSDGDGSIKSIAGEGTIEVRNRTDKTFRACVTYRMKATSVAPRSEVRNIVVTTGSRAADQEANLLAGEIIDVVVPFEFGPGVTEWTVSALGDSGLDGSNRRTSAAIYDFKLDGSFGESPACPAVEGS